MTDRDLTPAEARAEVEAFMGEGWTCMAESQRDGFLYSYTAACRGSVVVGCMAPTYRAAVDALKAAWRDAVRPWMEAAIDAKLDTADVDGYAPNERVIARVLKEDSNG